MGDIDGTTLAGEIRRVIIEQSYRANVGHIGSALSIAESWSPRCRRTARTRPTRPTATGSSSRRATPRSPSTRRSTSRAPARTGAIDTYCADGTLLGVHPEHDARGRRLLHRLARPGPFARCRRRARRQAAGLGRRVFVIISDAELNEGSTWEAVMFAAQHRLDNLSLLIDLNGQQALGYTRDVLDLGAVADKLSAFGWYGRDVRRPRPGGALRRCSGRRRRRAAAGARRPDDLRLRRLVHGDREIKWHYLPLTTRPTRPRSPSSRTAARAGVRNDFVDELVELAEADERVDAADRRPRLHGPRGVPEPVPGPLLQLRRRRAEHGRRRDRPRRGGLRAVRLLDRHLRDPAPLRVHPQRPRPAPAAGADRRRRRRLRLRPQRRHPLRARGLRGDARPAADHDRRPRRRGAGPRRAAGDRRPRRARSTSGSASAATRCPGSTGASSSAGSATVREGADAAIVAIGVDRPRGGRAAAELLAERGIEATVARRLLASTRARARTSPSCSRRAGGAHGRGALPRRRPRLAGRRDDRRARTRLPADPRRRRRGCRAGKRARRQYLEDRHGLDAPSTWPSSCAPGAPPAGRAREDLGRHRLLPRRARRCRSCTSACSPPSPRSAPTTRSSSSTTARPTTRREVLAELAERDPKVVVINHARAFGSQSAFT